MPRTPRKPSQSGFYHVTMRGNAKGIIFECDEHRYRFLKILRDCKNQQGFLIIAWCLMDNHVHLILNMMNANLSECLHWIGTTYASYFNRTEGRVGHVFQCPFGSKPIEYEGQLINTVRYVHLNPQRACICNAEEYQWSSYSEYANTPDLTDTDLALAVAGGVKQLLHEPLDEEHVVRPGRQMGYLRTKQEAIAIARKELGQNALSVLQTSNRKHRDKAIHRLWIKGGSVGHLARLCALSERTVRRVLAAEERRIEAVQRDGQKELAPMATVAKRN